MSKIALSGNASGTGTLTIAAPNTNSNYTLTIPGETGTLLTSASSPTLSNLTLSGGVYLGGTGAANSLDDYEEGTWDPQIFYQNATNQAAAVNNVQNGYYVKIGQMVIVSGYLQWTAPSSLANDNIGIKNLPFTSYANDGTNRNTCSLFISGATSTPTNGYMGIVYNNQTVVQITNQNDAGNYGDEIGTGTRYVGFTITYRVA
jgi:hypothetical protein